MSVSSKMTAIANNIRTLLGSTGTMGLDAMATNLDAAQTEVDGQSALIAQISETLAGKVGGGGGGSTPSGTKSITENGTHNVSQYEFAKVDVPGIVPSGQKSITTNGTHDVTDFASVNVNVPDTPAKVKEQTFTANGTYDIPSGYDGYGKVTVNVPTGTKETWTFTMESGSTVTKAVYVD